MPPQDHNYLAFALKGITAVLQLYSSEISGFPIGAVDAPSRDVGIITT